MATGVMATGVMVTGVMAKQKQFLQKVSKKDFYQKKKLENPGKNRIPGKTGKVASLNNLQHYPKWVISEGILALQHNRRKVPYKTFTLQRICIRPVSDKLLLFMQVATGFNLEIRRG